MAEGDESVVDSVLGLSPDITGIKDIVMACLQLPLCGFATPETWSGMHVHSTTCQHLMSRCLCASYLLPRRMSGCGMV